MPDVLREHFAGLWNELALAHYKWAVFLQMFGDETNFDLYDNTAPGFFDICHTLFLDDALMAVSRITDPANTGRLENLTVQRLINDVTSAGHADLAARMVTAYTYAQSQAALAREHRNRRIAHLDLSTRLRSDRTLLAPVTKAAVTNALNALARTVNLAEEHLDGSVTSFDTPLCEDGADLIMWLRRGYEHREQ